jgi:hypothetical protein
MTAEEFLNKKQKEYSKGIGNSFKTNYDLEKERLIEFAKIHVQQALQAATKESFAESSHSNMTSKDKLKGKQGLICVHLGDVSINENSILNAYSLNKIK